MTPTQHELESAAMVLGKIATADQWAAKPDAAMALTWAECFAVHNLQRADLLEGVVKLYADDKRDRTGRTLPADVIAQARKIRQDRQEREKAQVEGLPDVAKLSPERRAILACERCDEYGWIDIAGVAHRCTHGRELAS